jgi:hypothetical protein
MAASLSGWRSMDTAPEDRTVLGVVEGRIRLVRYGKTSHLPWRGFCLADQGVEEFDLCSPSHWMPLPDLPEQYT